jgi:Tfp pilus assembly protein PilF
MVRATVQIVSMLLAVTLLTACQQNKTPNPSEAAKAQWNTTRADVMFSLATDQYNNGDFDRARQTVDDAQRMDAKNAPLRILSAQLAIEQGQLDVADRELAVARTIDPKNPKAFYLSGVVYQRWEQPAKARDFYSTACDLDPGEQKYLLAKSEMLVDMDRADDALALLQAKVVFFENSPAIRDEVGLLLEQKNRWPDAADMFRRATILSPDDLTMREHLAGALFHLGEYADAAEALERVLADPRDQKRSDLYLMQGECRMNLNRVGDARESFTTAADLDPTSPLPLIELAKASIALGDTIRAEADLRRATTAGGDEADISLLRGYVRLREGRLDEAMAAFSRASVLRPDDPVSVCMMGYVQQKKGQLPVALGYYQQALKIKPTDELAGHLLAGLDAN